MNPIMVTGIRSGDTKKSTLLYYAVKLACNVTVEGRSVLVVYSDVNYHVYYSPFSVWAL